jgi:hypothetical protein
MTTIWDSSRPKAFIWQKLNIPKEMKKYQKKNVGTIVLKIFICKGCPLRMSRSSGDRISYKKVEFWRLAEWLNEIS